MNEVRHMEGVGRRLRHEFEREATGNPSRYAAARLDNLLDALADIPDASRVICSALNQARANNERRERMAAVE